MELTEGLAKIVKREAAIETKGPATVRAAQELRFGFLIRRSNAAQPDDAREVLQLARDLGFEMQRVQEHIEQRATIRKLEECVAAKAANLTRINDAARDVQECERALKRATSQIRDLNRQADAARVAITRANIAAEKLADARKDYPHLCNP